MTMDAIITCDAMGRIVGWSAAASALLGWQPSEVAGRPLAELVPEADRADWQAAMERLRSGCGVIPFIGRRVRCDSTWVDVAGQLAPVLDLDGRLVALTEVLRGRVDAPVESTGAAADRFETAFRGSPVALAVVRRSDLRLLEVNEAFCKLVGRSRARLEQMVAADWGLERQHPEADAIARQIERDGHVRAADLRLAATDGPRRHVLVTADPLVFGEEGCALLCMTDVTELRALAAAQTIAETRLNQVAGAIREAFWFISADGERVDFVSPAFEQIWGRPTPMPGEDLTAWRGALWPEDLPTVLDGVARLRRGEPAETEYRILRPDGETRWIRSRGFPQFGPDGLLLGFAGVAEDVTEHKSLEANMRQAAKMESMGQLAGGVAHDFNNLLTVIGGASECLREFVPADTDSADLLGEIQRAVDRATTLTRQLLAFSRQEVMEPRVVAPNDVVRDSFKLLRRLLGEDVELEVELAPELPRVAVDPGLWVSVIINLGANARDAMPQGGRLTLRTRVERPAEQEARTGGTAHGLPWVVFEVADTGVGIPEPLRARVFEPFFTTKAEGRGTGLGLAVVHGIVQQSGGTISVLPGDGGRGTCFRIALPRAQGAAADLSPERSTPLPRDGGSETLLVVEDEPALRRVATRILRLAGYQVLEAGDAREALDIAARYRGAIDLLFTDVVMPGMSGPELAQAFGASGRAGTRVLYTSGFIDGAKARHGVAVAENDFVRKPYVARELLRRVRQALGADATAAG
jgi:two-component system cell cycle sensor histidine kinase/response regulator CckA